MVDRSEQLLALAKRQGVATIAKVILEEPDKYAKAITEEEFVKMLTEEARAFQRQDESLGQTFSRMFQAQTDEGLLLRRAHQAISKANRPAMPTAAPVNKSADTAYDALVVKANKLREFDPSLSFAQAFNKVFTNPVNQDLANQERRENRPQSTFYPEGGERQ
jgi:hypothetical protein